jgi:hypothetical protein
MDKSECAMNLEQKSKVIIFKEETQTFVKQDGNRE